MEDDSEGGRGPYQASMPSNIFWKIEPFRQVMTIPRTHTFGEVRHSYGAGQGGEQRGEAGSTHGGHLEN